MHTDPLPPTSTHTPLPPRATQAWERADAYRPGKPNWFTTKQKSLVELHESLLPVYESSPTLPPPTNATSLLGSLLKVLTTGDLALTLCSKEPPVLTKLRDWLVEELPMSQAVLGLPEEQGRVLSVLVKALDARKILDLGTFTGYSSIAMALAAADDSKVSCCPCPPPYPTPLPCPPTLPPCPALLPHPPTPPPCPAPLPHPPTPPPYPTPLPYPLPYPPTPTPTLPPYPPLPR